jgi:predicted nucleic-acid-binding protein
MIAIDTNVLIRFLVPDHPAQAAAARRLFAKERIAIAHTVLLEAEWVLRRSFKFDRRDIASAFFRLLGLSTVVCPRSEMVLSAVQAFEAGCDFADALHAATSERGVTEFVTFDRVFAARAKRQTSLPPIRLLTAES